MLVDGTYRACCSAAITGGLVTAKTTVSPYNLVCCNSANVVIDASNVKWCCSASETNFTTNNLCCPSTQMIMDGKVFISNLMLISTKAQILVVVVLTPMEFHTNGLTMLVVYLALLLELQPVLMFVVLNLLIIPLR